MPWVCTELPLDENTQEWGRRMARKHGHRKLAKALGLSVQTLGMNLAGFPARQESRALYADRAAIERALIAGKNT